jgi:formate-dependent nitrite reductase cytochrome c552 subunit
MSQNDHLHILGERESRITALEAALRRSEQELSSALDEMAKAQRRADSLRDERDKAVHACELTQRALQTAEQARDALRGVVSRVRLLGFDWVIDAPQETP